MTKTKRIEARGDGETHAAYALELEEVTRPLNANAISYSDGHIMLLRNDHRSADSATSLYGDGSFDATKFLQVVRYGETVARVAAFHLEDNIDRLRRTVSVKHEKFVHASNEEIVITSLRLLIMNGYDENWPLKQESNGQISKASMIYQRLDVYDDNEKDPRYEKQRGRFDIGLGGPFNCAFRMTFRPVYSYLNAETEKRGAYVLASPSKREGSYLQHKTIANYDWSRPHKRKAMDVRCDEVMFFIGGITGSVVETSAQTPILYKILADGKGQLWVPPYADGRLDGITALVIRRIAEKFNIEMIDHQFTLKDIANCDAFILAGNAVGATFVSKIKRYSNDKDYAVEGMLPDPKNDIDVPLTPAGRAFFEEVIKGEFKTEVMQRGSDKYGKLLVYPDEILPDRQIAADRRLATDLRELSAEHRAHVKDLERRYSEENGRDVVIDKGAKLGLPAPLQLTGSPSRILVPTRDRLLVFKPG